MPRHVHTPENGPAHPVLKAQQWLGDRQMEMQYEELKVNQEVAQRTRLPSSLTDTLSRTSTSEGRTDASMLPSDLHMPHIPNKMNKRRNSLLKNSSSTYNWMNTATLIHVWALRRNLWRSKLPREGVCSSLRPFNMVIRPTYNDSSAFLRNLLPWADLEARPLHSRLLALKSSLA